MSGQKSSGESEVPLSVVFISIGVIILLMVAAIWLLLPSTMPSSVYNIIRPLVPEAIAIPTPAVVAYVPTLTPQPETAVILPTPLGINENEDNLVTMAEALAQEPLTGLPQRIVIPAIDLDAPITRIGVQTIVQDGQTYYQWLVPDEYAAGWQENSAHLGQPGNTVLNGHHNVFGEVFRDLVDLEEGDEIILYDEEKQYTYRITAKEILPERDQPLAVRLENAQWIAPTEDERITLITCWPYTDNSHRLVVVAEPIKTAQSQ